MSHLSVIVSLLSSEGWESTEAMPIDSDEQFDNICDQLENTRMCWRVSLLVNGKKEEQYQTNLLKYHLNPMPSQAIH